MTRKNCPHYDGCSAPLCPMLSDDENRKGLWYPGCRRNLQTKKKSSRLGEAAKERLLPRFNLKTMGTYFNLDMLKVPFRVTKQVKGLDPDLDIEDEPKQLKAWFKMYKGTKPRKLYEKSPRSKTAEHG